MKTASYVEIERDEFEEWLDKLVGRGGWERDRKYAGIYHIPLSPTVAVKVSSTVGANDTGMGAGKASGQFRLMSRVDGRVLNKKAQSQSHFARTINWRKNWVKGFEDMEKAYKKSPRFYDVLAQYPKLEVYTKQIMDRIEKIEGWNNNPFLNSIYTSAAAGSILTEKQENALHTMEVGVKPAVKAPPAPQKAVEPEHDLDMLRELFRRSKRDGDAWTSDFVASIGKRVKSGLALTVKQNEALHKALIKYGLK